MAYKLIKRNGRYLDNTDEFVCDAEADLSDISLTGAGAPSWGARAFCIAEGTTHYLDSTGTWVNPNATPEDTTPDAEEDT